MLAAGELSYVCVRQWSGLLVGIGLAVLAFSTLMFLCCKGRQREANPLIP